MSEKVVTTGRTDIDKLFQLSDILSSSKLNHTPFIVFQELDESIVIVLVRNKDDLLMSYPDETKVMVQWKGNWRSDFFHFTVGDVREYVGGQGWTNPIESTLPTQEPES